MYNMANLGRPLSRLCCLSSKSGSLSFNRHLFSSEILGVENFKRIRIFEKDRLPNKEDFVEQLSATCHGSQLQGRRVVADLMKLIYIADEKRDVQLVTDLLKQLYTNETTVLMCDKDRSTPSPKFTTEGPLSPRQFQFGPLLFRLLYILRDLATAQAFYSDKDLNWLFRSTTCHLLLMDMLYEDGRYQQVVDVFAALQRSGVSARFTPDCTTLAFAALYQLNSEESCREMRQMLEEAKAEGGILSRRCLLFAAALALRQRESSLALTIAESLSSSNGTLFLNIKLMALAQLGHLEEILATLDRKGPRGSPTIFHNGHLYSDTVQRLKEQIPTSGSSELKAKFNFKMDYLESEGLLSPQTVEHFVIRPILRQKKAKTSQSFKTRLKSPIKMKYNS